MDFIGFGCSDKLTERDEYSFQMHHDTLTGFIQTLALDQITLVVQDWGGLIGLTVASEMPERFARLVIMNSGTTPRPDLVPCPSGRHILNHRERVIGDAGQRKPL